MNIADSGERQGRYSEVFVGEEDLEQALPRRHRHAAVFGRSLVGVCASLLLLGLATRAWSWSRGGGGHRGVKEVFTWDEADTCGKLEENVRYTTPSELVRLTGVVTARICLAECNNRYFCKAWVYEGARGPCILYQAAIGIVPLRSQAQGGVMSGVPCKLPWLDVLDTTTHSWTTSTITPTTPPPPPPVTTPSVAPAAPAALPAVAPAAAPADGGHSQYPCGLDRIMEETDIGTQARLGEVEHLTMEECYAKCDANPDCGAWTWGKVRGVQGLSDVCYMKRLEPGEEISPNRNSDVVSGIPCHTS